MLLSQYNNRTYQITPFLRQPQPLQNQHFDRCLGEVCEKSNYY